MFLKHALGGVLVTAIAASAWNLDGTVVNTDNEPLEGVNITCYNYGGYTATSDAQGRFSIGDEIMTAIADASIQNKIAVAKNGNVLSIANPSGNSFKVSMMDALGKMMMQQEFNSQNTSIDIQKFAGQKFMILKVSSNSVNDNYIVSRGALMKAGDPLPYLAFSLTGYKIFSYTMAEEEETGKVFTLEKQDLTASSSSMTWEQPSSSSMTWGPASSAFQSSASTARSSSSVELIVNCASKTAKAGDQTMSVNVDGQTRTFIMHVPSAYKGDKAVPLVIDFHGIGGNGRGQMGGTQLRAQTDPEGVISLYPNGASAAWNVGPCCSTADDVKFTREMIKAASESACIDKKRVYASGFSMGGGMTNHLACNLADELAAVAPSAMDLNTVNSASCNPARPIPIIMYRSTSDGVCVYQGGDSGRGDGLNFLGAEKNFTFWGQKNGCTGNPTETRDGNVTVKEYSNCMDGVKVVFRNDPNAGHSYADGKSAWAFLKQWQLQ